MAILNLIDLCQLIAKKHKADGEFILTEEKIGQYFAANYHLWPPVTIETLIVTLKSEIDFFCETFNKELAGVCWVFKDKLPVIMYDPKIRPGNFTILHEIREVMDVYFREFGCQSWTSSEEKEKRCDKFAVSILMPTTEFEIYYQKYGPNIKTLADIYKTSYMSVCIRMRETLGYEFCIQNKSKRVIKESTNFKKNDFSRHRIDLGKYIITLAMPLEQGKHYVDTGA